VIVPGDSEFEMTVSNQPRRTPKLRMPAEWEPHAATWLAWPHYREDWPGKFEPIPWVYAEIIRQLARREPVELIVTDRAAEKRARKILDRACALSDNVRFHCWPTDRVWTRDSGCTFAIAEAASLAAIEWRFNAWAKYSNWQHDQRIGSLMAQAAGAAEIRPWVKKRHVVLEGGSIEVNGRGSLLTTEECLLSTIQQRNPGMRRADYERLFAKYLGCRNVIWLVSGIAGDDTHGHIDDLARFVAPDLVAIAVESDPKDPNYQPLRENVRRLREARDEDGKPLSIIELPMPAPIVFDRRRLPASYANFYIANGVVLVPVFNDPNDRFALDVLADLFPDRDVVGIYAGDLIWGFGAIHCMTQQQPCVERSPSRN
jgi:agmatine deiminase